MRIEYVIYKQKNAFNKELSTYKKFQRPLLLQKGRFFFIIFITKLKISEMIISCKTKTFFKQYKRNTA